MTLTHNAEKLLELIPTAFDRSVIKKLVFSRSTNPDTVKASGRLTKRRDTQILQIEFTLPSGTVRQENLTREMLSERLSELICEFKQVNLITTLGDAEYKVSKKGKDALIGYTRLKSALLSSDTPTFEVAIQALDRQKNYILNGNEDFLIELGISDKNGRVHDKKQGKFRQINRFLEHISDIYDCIPDGKEIVIYDLCCGKSYLSFAVYYYLTVNKKRTVRLLGIDLKADVIKWCADLAKRLGYDGMSFICDDVTNTPKELKVDMVISLHACDVATDVVINRAIELGAPIILSTPCCHRYLNDRIDSKNLSFVTKYPHLRNKICEAITDAIRALRLTKSGYNVSVLELTDPENTPKNTLIKAILANKGEKEASVIEYDDVLRFILGDGKDSYLKEICK